jgi:hypothetical protein
MDVLIRFEDGFGISLNENLAENILPKYHRQLA